MALLIVILVLIIITGANYFGRPITKRLWLVLLILSVLALVIVLLAYRNVGILNSGRSTHVDKKNKPTLSSTNPRLDISRSRGTRIGFEFRQLVSLNRVLARFFGSDANCFVNG
jgi:hypothetical protein